MRISGTEPSSVILSQTKKFQKLKSDAPKVSNQLNVKYKRTDALSLWHQQESTTVDIHGPLETRGETRCPGGCQLGWCYKPTKLQFQSIQTR